MGALGGGAAGYGLGSINWSGVGNALGNAGRWVGGMFQNGNDYWILYDGLTVTTYSGYYGNLSKSKQVQQYAGTSGGTGYQNSNNQNIPNVGPVPSGDYKINLVPDFTRIAKINAEDGSTKSNPDGGVELLPWGNGYLYDGWGQWRARLDKVNVNSTRNDFYFHDSYKGYSQGCIETNTALYYDLSAYKKGGQKAIKVKVKYLPNSPTNGGTLQNPPPWTDKMVKGTDGRMHPVPKPGAFP